MQSIVMAALIWTQINGQTPEETSSESNSVNTLGSMTILGESGSPDQVTGSATIIGEDVLRQTGYSEINKILAEVPGVSYQSEDGYGLRPNISIRGVATERSGRITLLEDNVLIAPAPYSAPSAYYFPTPGRFSAFEVLKGPAAITQGPYTIGGALNMISTPIPTEQQGLLSAEVGEDRTVRGLLNYGDHQDGFGYLLETHQWRSDGYQDIDRSDRDTGLDKRDYLAKFLWHSTDLDNPYQELELKLQYSTEQSEQSYLGLTDQDLNQDSTRRYGLSELDQIDTRHKGFTARYRIDLPGVSLGATAYRNEFYRDWFKTEGIDLNGSDSAADFDRTSWFNIIQAVNQGQDHDGFSSVDIQAILDGTADTTDGAIQLRSNAREYYSQGIQLRAKMDANWWGLDHALEVGFRYHEDEEDRLQRNSTYTQINGELVLDDLGLLGNAGNRIQTAEALAFHIYDRIEAGRWTFTPGVRYESIEQNRIRYEIRAGLTDDPSLRTEGNLRSSRQNDTSIALPGMGVLYQVSPDLTLLAGAHKGFSAPTNAPGVEPEEAINYELGLRYARGSFKAEVIGFMSDYENLLGVCTSSSGSDCEIGDAFNGDAATVKGLEVLLKQSVSVADLSMPLMLSYTFINGEFDTDIADTEFFGDVSRGDSLPYIPRHQLAARLGLEGNRWSSYLSAKYTDEACTRASCGVFESTEPSTIVDLSAQLQLNADISLFGRIENLTENDAIIGRQPYGARAARNRTGLVGIRYQF